MFILIIKWDKSICVCYFWYIQIWSLWKIYLPHTFLYKIFCIIWIESIEVYIILVWIKSISSKRSWELLWLTQRCKIRTLMHIIRLSSCHRILLRSQRSNLHIIRLPNNHRICMFSNWLRLLLVWWYSILLPWIIIILLNSISVVTWITWLNLVWLILWYIILWRPYHIITLVIIYILLLCIVKIIL